MLYAPDPKEPGWTAIPSQGFGGGGASGSVAQQVFEGTPATPTDATKPALRFPVGGGTLEQWTVGTQAWV